MIMTLDILLIALSALAAIVCVFLLVSLWKGRPLVEKVNNIIMEANMEHKKVNYKMLVIAITILLFIAVTTTAVNTYLYVTKLETPAFTQNQSVVVNVNSDNEDANRLDLNVASKEQLKELPGVGDVLADRIIDARPFYSVEQLKDVKGVGEATYVKLRGYVKVVGND